MRRLHSSAVDKLLCFMCVYVEPPQLSPTKTAIVVVVPAIAVIILIVIIIVVVKLASRN